MRRRRMERNTVANIFIDIIYKKYDEEYGSEWPSCALAYGLIRRMSLK